MGEPLRSSRLATAEDLRALPESVAAEVIGGRVVHKALPTVRHGESQNAIGGEIRSGFGRPPGGGGSSGWRIATEVEVEYEPHEVYRHDIAGWRRERMPAAPAGVPVRVRPDWVCEVLSPSNWSNDTVKKFRTLRQVGVPHYWIADVEHGTITVHEWRAGEYVTTVAGAGERARLPPFDAIELDVGALLGGEPFAGGPRESGVP